MTETYIPSSSNIDQIDYDEAGKILTITFKDGAAYAYTGVPRDVFFGIQHASSAGSYFYRQIRGRYPYSEI
jgi:hypothetical protein